MLKNKTKPHVINYEHENPLKKLRHYTKILWYSSSTIMALIFYVFPFVSILITSKLEEDFLYMAYADIMAKVTSLLSFASFPFK